MRDEKVKDVPCPKPRHTGWTGKCMECANEMKQNLEVGEPPVHAGLSRLLSRSDGQAPQRDENTKPTKCSTCGKDIEKCEITDCGHRGWVHVESGSHFCYADSATALAEPCGVAPQAEAPTPELIDKDGIYHCCVNCGWVPFEGMAGYLAIHGATAECIQCGKKIERVKAEAPTPQLNPQPTSWEGGPVWVVRGDYAQKAFFNRGAAERYRDGLKHPETWAIVKYIQE